MSTDILVLGKAGQLGRALEAFLGDEGHVADIADADMSSPDFIAQLDAFTKGRDYMAVFNAAAYTQVDKAEEEPELAERINATAVGELGAWCKARKLPLVHFSTDYVFDGSGFEPRNEKAKPSPLNVYGKTKLAGEKALAASGAAYLIFRTSWVYDAYGKNFFNTMLKLFAEKDELSVVSDQIGAPTYAPHLAVGSVMALEAALDEEKFPSGVYHLTGTGETSWHGFAQTILALATEDDSGQKSSIRCANINPIPTSEYPTPAKRPLNSRLDCTKAAEILGAVLPRWEVGLKECFKEKYASTNMSNRRA